MCLAAALFAASAANSAELSTILDKSRVTPPARVAFSEERHNPMFETPLVLEGYLEYLGPGSMRKVIESPFEEAFSIEAGEILMQRDGEIRRVPVNKSRALETMLGAFESVLAGDAERLETVFDYEVSGEASDWTIVLRPKSRRIGRQLSMLRLGGGEEGIRRIRIDLRDGEWHDMQIRHEQPMP